MKGNGLMINGMGMENLDLRMEISMKGNFQMDKSLGKER